MNQCIEDIKVGDSVQYNDKMHRVQDDKGWLFIQVTENGKRVKKGIDRILFRKGSLQDYIFNRRFEIFESFEEYFIKTTHSIKIIYHDRDEKT